MIDKYVLATNDDGDLAIRTVSATESSSVTDTTSVITATEDGKLAVRVVGGSGGGGDVHNKGYFATPEALRTAYPTAEPGDFAIVESTDTVWVWDSDTSDWKDSDTKGQVTSVNGQTGDVVLDLLPSQTGQSGKFLTTDGTDASWSDKPLVNTATQPGSGALGISATVTGYEALGIKTLKGQGTRSITIGNGSETQSGTESEMAIGRTAKAYGSYACAIGNQANAYGANCHAIGYNATAGDYRYYSTYGAWQFGSGTNNEAGTVCFALTTSNDYQHWTNYKLLDSDGTIPEARLADTTNATTGDVLTLDSNGNAVWQAGGGGGGSLPSQTGNSGKFLTTDGTNASWGEALKRVGSQSRDLGILASYVMGSFQGGTAIGIGAESESYGGSSVAMGYQAVAGTVTSTEATYSCVALGPRCKATGSRGIAIGYNAQATAACAMQIGPGTNSTANTCQLGYYNGSSFTTYQLLDFTTGTIPAARHATLPATDGTYTLQLVITNGVPTLSWVAV
jgi:hypothetical protein